MTKDTLPVLLIWGTQDRSVTADMIQKDAWGAFRRTLRGASMVPVTWSSGSVRGRFGGATQLHHRAGVNPGGNGGPRVGIERGSGGAGTQGSSVTKL
jgi:hypothetical protein